MFPQTYNEIYIVSVAWKIISKCRINILHLQKAPSSSFEMEYILMQPIKKKYGRYKYISKNFMNNICMVYLTFKIYLEKFL